MRWILITIAWVALAGAADTPAIQGWVGDLHVVDGYWVSRELPCGPDESDCTEEVLPVAIRGLRPSDRELVTRASVAAYRSAGVDEAVIRRLTETNPFAAFARDWR